MKKVKVLGLQRSGTTYLEHLIKQNFECDIGVQSNIDICWKHALPNCTKYKVAINSLITNDGLAVQIVKQFNQWSDSIKRFPADFFIKNKEVKTETQLKSFYDNYIEEWDIAIVETKVNIVRINYLDLISNLSVELDKLKLPRQTNKYIDIVQVPQSRRIDNSMKTKMLKTYGKK